MSHVIQLDDDLSHSISALAHALSPEISDDNVPSNSFENIANTLLNGLLNFPKDKIKAVTTPFGWECVFGEKTVISFRYYIMQPLPLILGNPTIWKFMGFIFSSCWCYNYEHIQRQKWK